MKKKIRIGVIGCGAIAEHAHLAEYAALKDVEIAALADIHTGRLEEMSRKFGVERTYTDYRELLAQKDLDAVSICTPNYLHAEMAIAAAEAGKHVLTEKPMAVTLDEARAMIAAAEKNHVTLMVGFTHRFYNYIRKAKEMLEGGFIGKPVMIKGRFAHEGPYTSWSAKSDWFFDKTKAGGGALLDMGIHGIDLFRYFGGEIKTVTGQIGNVAKNIAVEDAALMTMTFASGAMGALEVGWSSKRGSMGIEIYGTEGTILVDYTTPFKLLSEREVFGKVKGWIYPDNVGGGGWDKEMEHFVECVREGKKPFTSGEDGLAALKVALAVYESARTGRTLQL